MTAAEVAKRLRIDTITVRRMLKTGKLHGTYHATAKLGHWDISEEDLHNYLMGIPQCTCAFFKGREHNIYFRLHAPTCPLFKSLDKK